MTKEKTLYEKRIRDFSNNPIPNYYWENDLKQTLKEVIKEIDAEIKFNKLFLDNKMSKDKDYEFIFAFQGKLNNFKQLIKTKFGEEFLE